MLPSLVCNVMCCTNWFPIGVVLWFVQISEFFRMLPLSPTRIRHVIQTSGMHSLRLVSSMFLIPLHISRRKREHRPTNATAAAANAGGGFKWRRALAARLAGADVIDDIDDSGRQPQGAHPRVGPVRHHPGRVAEGAVGDLAGAQHMHVGRAPVRDRTLSRARERERESSRMRTFTLFTLMFSRGVFWMEKICVQQRGFRNQST